MALPLLAPLADTVAFRCTAPPLAAIGIGVGGLLTARRLVAARGRRSSSGPAAERVAVAVLVGAVPLILLVTGWSPPSGDEPNYLVVAHSLINDGDLDLSNDYRERVYEPFHPGVLSPHYRPGLREGTRYSMHGIGLPLLVAPAYAVGSAAGGGLGVGLPRTLLAVVYGVFAWLLYGFLADVGSRRVARYGTLATGLTAPLLFSPLYLFPEVPAMLLALYAFQGFYKGGGGDLRHGSALALLPFFGVKYLPLAGAVLVAGVFATPSGPGSGGRAPRLFRAGLPLAVAMAAHALFTWSLYGSISPAAIYLGAGDQAGAPALGGDWGAYLAAWPGAVATAIGFLLDQKEGLLAYGPHYLLAFAGVGWMWRRQPRLVLCLAMIAAAHVGPYALSQQLGGQGPPVRPLMAVLWVLAPFLGIALALRPSGAAYRALRAALLALGGMLTVAYAVQPELLPHDYPVVASRLLQNYSPYESGWWRFFPQWVNVETPNTLVTAAWAAVVLVVGAALARQGWATETGSIEEPTNEGGPGGRPSEGEKSPPVDGAMRPRHLEWRVAMAVVALIGAMVVLHNMVVLRTDRHRPTLMGSNLTVWLPEQLPPVAFAEVGGIWATPGVAVDAIVTSPNELESIDVSIRSLVPTEAEASIHGQVLAGRVAPGDNLVARLRPGPAWADGDRFAYGVRLRAADGASPADLFGGDDERHLAVLLEIIGQATR